MPNWCNNNLVITGDKTERDKFVKQSLLSPEQQEKQRQEHDILGQLYPTPQELVETGSGFSADPEKQAERERKQIENISKYGHKDWYDWNIANWGTKWAPRVEELSYDNDAVDEQWRVEIRYETAWAPPTKLIQTLSRLFPTLTFHTTFDEESQAFVGCEIFVNGNVYGEYFEPCGKDLPEGFAERWEAIQAKFENDLDDDAFQDLLDFQSDLKDVAETRALAQLEDYFTAVSK